MNTSYKGMNFTEQEIGYIVKAIGTNMTTRMTAYGNVIMKHVKSQKPLYALYKNANGIFIRRRLGYDNPFGSGHVLNAGRCFPNVESAMEYFVSYMKKYPKSLTW